MPHSACPCGWQGSSLGIIVQPICSVDHLHLAEKGGPPVAQPGALVGCLPWLEHVLSPCIPLKHTPGSVHRRCVQGPALQVLAGQKDERHGKDACEHNRQDLHHLRGHHRFCKIPALSSPDPCPPSFRGWECCCMGSCCCCHHAYLAHFMARSWQQKGYILMLVRVCSGELSNARADLLCATRRTCPGHDNNDDDDHAQWSPITPIW